MNVFSYNMTSNTKSVTSDGALKRVRTEVSDSSSSDDESMTKFQNSKKWNVVSSDSWPRFLIIASSDDGNMQKLSPFAIQKGLVGLSGEPKSLKKLKNGTLLIECSTLSL